MIRLIATDMDGTIIWNHEPVRPVVLDAVQHINDRQGYFAVATGRDRFLAGKDSKVFPGGCDTICMNGALVMDKQNNVIHEQLLDKQFIKAMMEAFPNAALEYVTKDEKFTTCSKEEMMKHITRAEGTSQEAHDSYVEFYLSHTQFGTDPKHILESPILKVNGRISEPDIREGITKLAEHYAHTVINAPSNPRLFEFTDINVNKGEGVDQLRRILGLEEDEVAVYGDGCNDLAMLSRFENSYCPADGHKEALETAHFIIGKCEDGEVPLHMMKLIDEK